jgi:uncharacterized protein YndB with AHSA1/START domain
MSEQKPFRVEVLIEAPREVVWRALTEPAEMRRWFGWDYDGLDEEIRFIFSDHATPVPPDRIELDDPQTIELAPDGPRTLVRVIRPGPPEDAEWDDLYDEMEEGWLTFLHQLRHQLERHRGEDRRTLFLDGKAVPTAVLAALDARAQGRPWHQGPHQRGLALGAYGGGLVVAAAAQRLDSDTPARLTVTVTTHGLDDAAFAELRQEWSSWWGSLADDPRVTP